MTSAIAVVPARSGSKGVPHKNVANVGGHPLLAYSIAAAKISGVDRVLVSTDSQAYAEIARKYGAEVPFLRPPELATDESSDFEFMSHLLSKLLELEGEIPKLVLHLRPTSPLRKPTEIMNALETLQNAPEASSLRSGHRAVESPFKWFCRDDRGYFVGVDPTLTPADVNRPRQSFNPVFIPNGAVDVLRTEHVLSSTDLHGSRMLVFETDPLVEVDEPDQLEDIRRQLLSHRHPIQAFLDDLAGSI